MVPLLHRPTFLRAFDSGLHLRDDKFASLVLLVCATAARYSTDPRVLLENGSWLSAGWKWFKQVEPFSSTVLSGPELFDLQVVVVRITLSVWPACIRADGTTVIIAFCGVCPRFTSTSRRLDNDRRWSTACTGCRRAPKRVTQGSSNCRRRALETCVLVGVTPTLDPVLCLSPNQQGAAHVRYLGKLCARPTMRNDGRKVSLQLVLARGISLVDPD